MRTPTPYGVLLATGFLAAGGLGCVLARRKGLKPDNVILLEAYVAVFGLLGAKLLYFAVSDFRIDWARITEWRYLSSILGSGFVFYGGVLGGLAALALARWLHAIGYGYLRVIVPALPLAHGFGRLGCYLAGCCYGIPWDGPLHVVYTTSAAAPVGVALFPVQLVEALFNLLLATALTVYVWCSKAPAWGPYIYILAYAPARFFLEFLRADTAARGGVCGLSASQMLSLLFLAALPFLRRIEKRATGRAPGSGRCRHREEG